MDWKARIISVHQIVNNHLNKHKLNEGLDKLIEK